MRNILPEGACPALRGALAAFPTLLAAATCLLCAPPARAADHVDMSFSPPGGLSVDETPVFVVLGFDDNRYIDGMQWILQLLEGKANPKGKGNPSTYDGQPLMASFYFTSGAVMPNAGEDPAYKADLLKLWKKAVAAGYEVANHTHTHETTGGHTKEQWVQEISTCTKNLVDLLGVRASDIRGFRTPYLDFGRPTFEALKETGMLYEATVTHQGDYNKRQHVWPYTLDKGFSPLASGPAAADWAYPGIWEIPVYTTSVDITGHPPVTGFDSSILTQAYGDQFAVMLLMGLDYRLTAQGNHSPYTVGLHSDTYSDENASAKVNYDPRLKLADRKKALSDFIDYALTKPNVRFVTAMQLIQWMRNPVGLSDVRPVAAKPRFSAPQAVPQDLVKMKGEGLLVKLPRPGAYTVSVVSLQGKRIYRARHVNAGPFGAFATIPAAEFPAGALMVKVEGPGFIRTRMLARP